VLRRELVANVELLQQDIRREMPAGPFHLILCRYLAFTYFDNALQREIAKGLLRRIARDGYLALGKHESWPAEVPGLEEARRGLRVYRRSPGSTTGQDRCSGYGPCSERRSFRDLVLHASR
jgi:chemotaxis protein methyltransferase CheR